MFRLNRLDPWIVAAIAAALAVRLANLGEAALWFDETWTAQQIRLAWGDLIRVVLFDEGANHLPLYFLLAKVWSTIWGFSPIALRLFSVVLSMVTVVLIAGIARTIADEKSARWAVWLAAISPYLLHHAQEARMYPLMSALTAASIILLARFLKGHSSRLGIGFVLANLALLTTHYYAMFIVSAVIIVVLLFQRQPISAWLPAISVTVLGVMGLMLAAILVASHHSGASYDIGLLAMPGVGWSVLSGYTLLPSAEELHAIGARAAFPYLVLAVPAIIPLGIGVVAGIIVMDREARLLILITIAIPLLAPFIVRIIFPEVSINPRYVMSAAPSFLVLLAVGLAHGFRRNNAVKISAFLLGGIMIAGSARHHLTPGHGREDIYAAGFWLDKYVPVDEEILVTSDEMYHLARFHWPDRRFYLYPARKIVANRENAAEIINALPFPQANRVVYIFGRTWLSDP